MKITLNTETGNMIVSIMRITGGSISKTVRDALKLHLEQLQSEKDHYDPTNTPKTFSSTRSNQEKG